MIYVYDKYIYIYIYIKFDLLLSLLITPYLQVKTDLHGTKIVGKH